MNSGKADAQPAAAPPPSPGGPLQADYEEFRRLLRKALKNILWPYFRTPVACRPGGGNATAVRERLFCYELYHQLRCACDKADFGYWLGGELDKDKHPIIAGGPDPDLVVHEPGDMDHYLCVLEVKPISGSRPGFKKDVNTLTTFTTNYAYHAGILLVYGDRDSAETVIRSKVGTDLQALRTNRVFVLWIRNAQSEPVELQ